MKSVEKAVEKKNAEEELKTPKEKKAEAKAKQAEADKAEEKKEHELNAKNAKIAAEEHAKKAAEEKVKADEKAEHEKTMTDTHTDGDLWTSMMPESALKRGNLLPLGYANMQVKSVKTN